MTPTLWLELNDLRGTRPWLGRKPMTLLNAAGLRSDPMANSGTLVVPTKIAPA